MAIKLAAELKAYFETVDIPTQQQFVDLIDTMFSAVPNYKVYTALLNQSGTDAPVATILENTLGVVPVWGYASAGTYTLDTQSPHNKTVIFIEQCSDSVTTNSKREAQDGIWEITTNIEATIKDNGLMRNTSVEIRVYN